MVDMEVNVIHTYSAQLDVVNESHIGSEELDSHIALVDHVGPSTMSLDLDSFGAFSIGSSSLVTKDNIYHVNNLEPSTLLSLLQPDLIDWSI